MKKPGFIINPFPTYMFLSGFVFLEPSPAEFFFLAWLFFLFSGWIGKLKFDKTAISIFMIFLVLESASLLAGYDFGINVKYILIDLYLFSVFFFFVCYYKNYPLPINELAIAASIAGIIGILSYFFISLSISGPTFFGVEIIKFGGRYKGFFKDPNVAGPFLVLPFLFFLESLIGKRDNYYRNSLILLLLFSGIFISYSRAAWLNVFLGSVILIFLKRRSFFKLKTIAKTTLMAILVIFASILVLQLLDHESLFYARLGLQGYDQERFAVQKIALESPSFWTGSGPGSYILYSNYAAHSLFIRHLGEMGILGLTFSIFFLAVAGYGLFTIRKNFSFLFATFAGIIGNSFFVDTWHWRHFWILIICGYVIFLKGRTRMEIIK